MDIPLSELNLSLNKCKDLIILVLTKKSRLSAKRVYKYMINNFPVKFSYQAVHKSLQILSKDKILKKFDGEYYINPDWVDYVYSFLDNIKNRKNTINKYQEVKNINYVNHKLKSNAIRFIPFYFGECKEFILKNFEIVNKDNNLINFKDKEGNDYYLFDTGVCVIKIEEDAKYLNPLSFLIERRKTHINILESKTNFLYTRRIFRDLNIPFKIGYVMSIHLVEPDQDLPKTHFNNILKIMTQPGILNIHDNKKIVITNQHIIEAKEKMNKLSKSKIEGEDILDMSIDNNKRIYASWSNVILSCEEEEMKILKKQIIELEIELQQLWYYFYRLKNDLRNNLRKSNFKEIKKLLLKRVKSLEKYNNFINTNPLYDSQYLILKEGLIKTSKLKKIFRELENMYDLCKLKMES